MGEFQHGETGSVDGNPLLAAETYICHNSRDHPVI